LTLDHLLATVPEWFHVTSAGPTELLGSINLHLDNAVRSIRADIRVRERDGVILVQEQVPGTRFPRTCHERHIQSDEHFCIGLNAGSEIASTDHAVVWWGLLRHFLELQRVAERTRRWPALQEMAHGDAGPHQRSAMEAAAELGIEDQYMRMLEGEQVWFSDASLWDHLQHIEESGIPCPMECHDRGNPVSLSTCWHHEAVVRLVTEERLRRKKVEEYYDFVRLRREECCGTMLGCPLAKGPTFVSAITPVSNP